MAVEGRVRAATMSDRARFNTRIFLTENIRTQNKKVNENPVVASSLSDRSCQSCRGTTAVLALYYLYKKGGIQRRNLSGWSKNLSVDYNSDS